MGSHLYCTETDNTGFIQSQMFLCQLASEFSELVSRLSDFALRERCKVSMESLILAQDERWRRA